MNESIKMMETINQYRKEKGFTIQSFVEGISSERNYRRYLYGEVIVPIDVFFKFLDKLEIEVSQFLTMSMGNVSYDNIEVLYAISLCLQDKFDHAEIYYQKAIKENKSILGYEKLMELVELAIKHNNKLLTTGEYMKEFQQKYDLKKILKQKVITKPQLFALSIVLKYLNNDDKYQISVNFLNYLENTNYRVLTNDLQNAKLIMVEKGLTALLSIEEKEDKIKPMLRRYLEHMKDSLYEKHYVTSLSFVESLFRVKQYYKLDTTYEEYYFYVFKMMNTGLFVTSDDLEKYNIESYFHVLETNPKRPTFIEYCEEVLHELN